MSESTNYLLNRLWYDWLRQHLPHIVCTVLLMIVVAATSAAYPKLIELAIDMLSRADPKTLTLLPASIILITFIRGIASYGQSVMNQSVTLRVIAELQKAMFARLMNSDIAMMQSLSSGSLISRFTNDVNLMRDALSRTLTTMCREFLTAVALLGMMFYMDWMLTLIVIVIFPFAGRPIIRLGRRLRRASANVQTGMGSLTATLSQSFGGIRLIKSYGLEDAESKRTDWLFDEVYRLIMKTVKGRARTQPILEILGGIAIALVLTYGGYRIITGAGTLGEFVGFISAVIMILQPVRSLGNLNASLQEGLAALNRTFDLLDTKPKITEKSKAQELQNVSGHLQLSDITFSYDVNKPSLKNFSIDIPAGKKIALVGPSGAGKSTVFNLILRFYDPEKGEIKIDGKDIRDLKLASLRDNIAFVGQDITLFNASVEANIGFGDPKAGSNEIKSAAMDATAHEFIQLLPNGYKTLLGEKGAKLSGGERQRIAIARAFLKNAPILLFDEATSSLDSQSEKQVHQALIKLTKNRTTIVIAHRLTTVTNADMIYVIDEGKIIEKGTHADLISREGLYSRLTNIQFNLE